MRAKWIGVFVLFLLMAYCASAIYYDYYGDLEKAFPYGFDYVAVNPDNGDIAVATGDRVKLFDNYGKQEKYCDLGDSGRRGISFDTMPGGSHLLDTYNKTASWGEREHGFEIYDIDNCQSIGKTITYECDRAGNCIGTGREVKCIWAGNGEVFVYGEAVGGSGVQAGVDKFTYNQATGEYEKDGDFFIDVSTGECEPDYCYSYYGMDGQYANGIAVLENGDVMLTCGGEMYEHDGCFDVWDSEGNFKEHYDDRREIEYPPGEFHTFGSCAGADSRGGVVAVAVSAGRPPQILVYELEGDRLALKQRIDGYMGQADCPTDGRPMCNVFEVAVDGTGESSHSSKNIVELDEGSIFGRKGGIYAGSIPNTPPVASFTVAPLSGDTTTIFQFDASASRDAEDDTANLLVRWDWENDGTWDTLFSSEKLATHQYATTGTKTIKLEVKDMDGAIGSTTRDVDVYDSGANTPPEARFTVAPLLGDTTTVFKFDASGCTDTEDGTDALRVRWDFDNDGTYEIDWTYDKEADYHYSSAGTKTIKLEVIDSGGATDYETKDVEVGGCGNGIVEGGEQCDTGNGAPDTCTGGMVCINCQCTLPTRTIGQDLIAITALEMRNGNGKCPCPQGVGVLGGYCNDAKRKSLFFYNDWICGKLAVKNLTTNEVLFCEFETEILDAKTHQRGTPGYAFAEPVVKFKFEPGEERIFPCNLEPPNSPDNCPYTPCIKVTAQGSPMMVPNGFALREGNYIIRIRVSKITDQRGNVVFDAQEWNNEAWTIFTVASSMDIADAPELPLPFVLLILAGILVVLGRKNG